MKIENFIGVDVSKATLDLTVRNIEGVLFHSRIDNSILGIKGFITECKLAGIKIDTSLFCMEFTGIYNNILLRFISKKKYKVWVEQAINIKRSLGFQRG